VFAKPWINTVRVDDHSAQVTFTDSGSSVSAHMVFDDAGRPINVIAQRYHGVGGNFSLDPWPTPIEGYGARAGLNLPVHGQAVWNLPSGALPYWDGEIAEVEYNQPTEAFPQA
jgi:hypothetical protein